MSYLSLLKLNATLITQQIKNVLAAATFETHFTERQVNRFPHNLVLLRPYPQDESYSN